MTRMGDEDVDWGYIEGLEQQHRYQMSPVELDIDQLLQEGMLMSLSPVPEIPEITYLEEQHDEHEDGRRVTKSINMSLTAQQAFYEVTGYRMTSLR